MSKQALYDRGVGRDYATVTIGEKTKDGKIVIHEMLKGRDAERWIEENVSDSNPSTPIPPTAYHNVFPPITSEGIQEASKRLEELRARRDKENAENLAGVPMREPLPPRVPDLCPDDMGFARVDIIKQEQRRAYESAHGPACGCDDCEEERNR